GGSGCRGTSSGTCRWSPRPPMDASIHARACLPPDSWTICRSRSTPSSFAGSSRGLRPARLRTVGRLQALEAAPNQLLRQSRHLTRVGHPLGRFDNLPAVSMEPVAALDDQIGLVDRTTAPRTFERHVDD